MELPENIVEGSMLLVDKPAGWTSFDVVNKVRFAIRKAHGIRKIKVGHAGTLDPLATGLLILCTGKMTKSIVHYQGLDKTYTGIIRLGATTPTYDQESEIDAVYPTEHIDTNMIRDLAARFQGAIMQKPPIFSAIKKEGQRLYEAARKKQDVVVEPRPVVIHEFEICRVEMPQVYFKVVCSKGTYIRSLAYDLGQALDSGGYLELLRRTAIGHYSVDDAWNLELLIEEIGRQA